MSGDRIEPGAKRTPVLVQPALQMDLQERVLEHVVRERRITEITGQIAVEFTLVAMNQFGEHSFRTVVPIPAHEFLVRLLSEVFRRIGPDGLNHVTHRRRGKFKLMPGTANIRDSRTLGNPGPNS